MDCKEMEQLLQRYWQGDTSLEEEDILRTWFARGDVPSRLLCYRDWFVYVNQEQMEQLPDDFDARVLAAINRPVVKARSLSMKTRLLPLLKAVAVVAFIVVLGNVAQHPLWLEPVEVAAVDTIGKQITTPSVARSDEAALNEKQLLDSLKQAVRTEDQKKQLHAK